MSDERKGRKVEQCVVSEILLDTAPVASASPLRPVSGCRILLVEDSMIVALDGEDALRDLGAGDVIGASTSVVRARSWTRLAILDSNLGEETSLPVAEPLLASKVRFISQLVL